MGTSIFSPQSGTISVEYEDGSSELLPNQFVLIATGSRPQTLPFLEINHQNILSSDDILQIDTLPHSIAIVGGGVIGLEFASLLTDLNVNVKVIEAGKRILPSDSKSISTFLRDSLIERGVEFFEDCQLSEENIIHKNDVIQININEKLLLQLIKY